MLCSAFPMLLICFFFSLRVFRARSRAPPWIICTYVHRSYVCVSECVCKYSKCIEWHEHIAARVHDSWTSYPILRNLAQVWDVQSISSVPQFTTVQCTPTVACSLRDSSYPICDIRVLHVCAGVRRCLNIAENCIDFVQSRRNLKELSHSPMHSILFMVFVDDLRHPGYNEYG